MRLPWVVFVSRVFGLVWQPARFIIYFSLVFGSVCVVVIFQISPYLCLCFAVWIVAIKHRCLRASFESLMCLSLCQSGVFLSSLDFTRYLNKLLNVLSNLVTDEI